MTMTFMDGVKITKKDALATLRLDPYDVATKLIKVFYKQLFVDRFFHADPHPGNFFVQRGPEGQVRIVVLDLGSATQLNDNLADGMFDILSGLMTRKDDLVVKGIDTMGFVAPSGDRAPRAHRAQVLREAARTSTSPTSARSIPNVAAAARRTPR